MISTKNKYPSVADETISTQNDSLHDHHLDKRDIDKTILKKLSTLQELSHKLINFATIQIHWETLENGIME